MDPWRLILDPPLSGEENMAIDEAIVRVMEAYYEDGVEQMPTLRLYSWVKPTVSIGYTQKADPFIEREGNGVEPVPFIRRITGGRAVLHDSEITYSLVCPASHPLFSTGIEEAYRAVSLAITGSLIDLGIEAGFERGSVKRERGAREDRDACFLTPSRYEVTARKKKIAGSAQRRFKGALLQHGSILLNVDKALTEKVFGKGVAEDIASINDFTDLGPDAVDNFKGDFIERLADTLDAEFFLSRLSVPEHALMQELKDGKYLSREWNERAPHA
ncbi:MAG: lipoate--protein ligase family protein [Proteobacteria bacterium]|nr:lipoate--protein ligase family protein [Pseudomonadota bacterium]